MARNRVRIDYRALKKIMARSKPLEQFIQFKVAAAKTYAESISPDAPPIGAGYKASWVVETGRFPDGVPFGRVANTDPKWAVVEYGSAVGRPQGGSSPARHVLSQTLFSMRR